MLNAGKEVSCYRVLPLSPITVYQLWQLQVVQVDVTQIWCPDLLTHLWMWHHVSIPWVYVIGNNCLNSAGNIDVNSPNNIWSNTGEISIHIDATQNWWDVPCTVIKPILACWLTLGDVYSGLSLRQMQGNHWDLFILWGIQLGRSTSNS